MYFGYCMCMYLCAHINNGISLDVVHVRILDAQLFAVSLCCADDTYGHGVLQGKGATDGNDKLTRSQIGRTAQRQHMKLLLLSYGQTQ